MYLTPYWNCDFSLCLLWSKALDQNERLSLVFKTVIIWRLLHCGNDSAKCLFYMNRGLQTVRGYSPPQDVEARVHDIASDMYGETKDWLNHRLDNKADKLQVYISVMDSHTLYCWGGANYWYSSADLRTLQSSVPMAHFLLSFSCEKLVC